MKVQRFRARNIGRVGLWLALPVACAMIVLAASGSAEPGAAFVAGVAILLAQLLFAGIALRALDAALALIRSVLPDSPPVEGAEQAVRRFPVAEEIAFAVSRVRRELARSGRLPERNAILLTLLDALPEPAVLLTRERRILRQNQAAVRLFEEDGEGRDVATLLRDPALLDAVDIALSSGEERDVEFRLRHPVEHDLHAYACPLRLADSTAALLVTLHDLTALRRTDEMRSDFLANVSHELRTPLSSLIGFIETLRGAASEDPSARERFLEIMETEAQRMSGLVEDLTSLSRIELEERSRPTSVIELLPLLQSLVEVLQPRASARGMGLRIVAPPAADPPIRVVADREQLYQVFENLVTNAIKYGAPGTPVAITVEPATEAAVRLEASRAARAPKNGETAVTALAAPAAGRFCAVSVGDQGDGIEAEHLGRLTERFYRVDTARSRSLGGTGLGLAIVKHILSRHRGRLDIRSTVGAGATFVVWLPAPQQEAPGPT